jgi:hypothetical protein
MSDKAPVEGAPTPLTVFEPVEGVFLGFVEGCHKSLGQIVYAANMQKNQVYQDKHQVDGGISIPLSNFCRGQMTLNAQDLKQFSNPQVQIGQRKFEHCFDLSLKRCKFSIMHKEAPSVWFFVSELVHLTYHSLGAFSIKS